MRAPIHSEAILLRRWAPRAAQRCALRVRRRHCRPRNRNSRRRVRHRRKPPAARAPKALSDRRRRCRLLSRPFTAAAEIRLHHSMIRLPRPAPLRQRRRILSGGPDSPTLPVSTPRSRSFFHILCYLDSLSTVAFCFLKRMKIL